MLSAIVVGAALRLAWTIAMTGSPLDAHSDPARYLEMAEGLAAGRWPTLAGRPSAFFPPGYPMFLAPTSAFSRATGLLSEEFAASLLNVVIGTATVAAVGMLAARFGRRAATAAAWIAAVAPGAIFLTSVALADTLLAAVPVIVILIVQRSFPADAPRPGRAVVAMLASGVLVGIGLLARPNLGLLLLVPVLMPPPSAWRNRVTLLRAASLIAGLLLVTAPWIVRNGRDVGVWVPSTGGASFMCMGHHPGATGEYDGSWETLSRCFGGSPVSDPRLYEPGQDLSSTRPGETPPWSEAQPVDEARWYRRTTREAIAWAVRHPGREVVLAIRNTATLLAPDDDALAVAETTTRGPISPTVRSALGAAADLWHWGVLAGAIITLGLVPRIRRDKLLWVVPVCLIVSSWAGLAQSRHQHAIMPMLVVVAAGGAGVLGDTIHRRGGIDALRSWLASEA